MPVKVVLGLPSLANGPLLAKAREMQAPVLVSANALSRWVDDGPAPKGYEFSRAQWQAHHARGGTGTPPPGRPRRMRTWAGWNTTCLKNAAGLQEAWLDSAGYVAMSLYQAFPWTAEAYIYGLCAAYPWTRFASLDYCVEPEISGDADGVRERISRTIAANFLCQKLSNDVGIGDRLMPVIQGSSADDYLRCFDALHSMIGDERIIGVGSMCRRDTAGPDGIVSIVDELDRRLPRGVLLHLFGAKGDGAEAIADLDHRVYSLDSQAYGTRARYRAAELRQQDPAFSKSNAFVASIMETWYRNQVARMANPRPRSIQNSLSFGQAPSAAPASDLDTLLARARRDINGLIEAGEIDHDAIVSDRMLLDWAMMIEEDEAETEGDDLPLAA